MDASVTASIIAGFGVILAAWLGFMGSKKGTLAQAEQQFRTTILEENRILRGRVEKLELKFSDVLNEKNVLIGEKVQLQARVKELEAGQTPQVNTTVNIVSPEGANV